MKKLISEFREFATRGNVVDLAVGVMIGAAFRAIVDSLVNDVLSPLIGLFVRTDFSTLCWQIGDVRIGYGAFLMSILNFVLLSVLLFVIVRTCNRLARLGKKQEAQEPVPVPRLCPFCRQEIAPDAVRCPHCTSVLADGARPADPA